MAMHHVCRFILYHLIELDLKHNGYTDKPVRIARLREILNEVLDTFYIPELNWNVLFEGVNNLSFNDLEDSYQYEAACNSFCDLPLLSFNNCHDHSRSIISGKRMKKE